ncbi:MAG: Two-component system, NarL family, sensor histidine kinase DesK [Mycobacterium sp.]|nr:Two-component system, NarL family, sensor histidine kinase DesK [Mycobacterium sp.]
MAGRLALAARSGTVPLIVLCVGYGAEPLLTGGFGHLGPGALSLALPGIVAFSVLIVLAVWRGAEEAPARGKPWELVAAGYLALALYLRFGPAVISLPALFGGAAAFLLTRWRSVGLVALSVGCLYAALLRRDLTGGQRAELMGRALIVMAVVYAAGRLLLLTRVLDRNRGELARLAVVEERLRFSRDLHDVLGRSLCVIALKGEVAARLVTRDPCAAAVEMTAVANLARQSVADTRAIVRGYRGHELGAEVEEAVSVLEAASVRCAVDPVPDGLPEPVREAFGWVIREGVTNVLRHSVATWCGINVRIRPSGAELTITNDGVRPPVGRPVPGPGNGLAGLTERLAALGGSLLGERTGGEFHLVAHIPGAAVPGPTVRGVPEAAPSAGGVR